MGVTWWAPPASYGSDHWCLCFSAIYSIHGTLAISSEQGMNLTQPEKSLQVGDDFCFLKANSSGLVYLAL